MHSFLVRPAFYECVMENMGWRLFFLGDCDAFISYSSRNLGHNVCWQMSRCEEHTVEEFWIYWSERNNWCYAQKTRLRRRDCGYMVRLRTMNMDWNKHIKLWVLTRKVRESLPSLSASQYDGQSPSENTIMRNQQSLNSLETLNLKDCLNLIGDRHRRFTFIFPSVRPSFHGSQTVARTLIDWRGNSLIRRAKCKASERFLRSTLSPTKAVVLSTPRTNRRFKHFKWSLIDVFRKFKISKSQLLINLSFKTRLRTNKNCMSRWCTCAKRLFHRKTRLKSIAKMLNLRFSELRMWKHKCVKL